MSGNGQPVVKPVLMLDVHCLERLFPEGSEARIELRRVAVTEMSQRLLGDASRMPQQVQAEITKAINERKAVIQKSIDQCVQDYEAKVQAEGLIGGYIKPTNWHNSVTPVFTLTDDAKKAIAEEIKRQVNDTIHQIVGAMLPEMFKTFLSQEKVGKFVDQHIQQQLKTVAGQKVQALFREPS